LLLPGLLGLNALKCEGEDAAQELPSSCDQIVASVTELILGHRGLGEESNYDYSKLKRKGKERESNASYFTINTSVCVR
jgi:hypothetical protein